MTDKTWLNQFGIVDKIVKEDFGLVQSLRVFYHNKLEVEFGFATVEWASVSPVDEGTKRVISDGIRILYDKNKILDKLVHNS